MTLTRLAWANLRAAPMTSALNVVLLALGTATIVVLLLLSHQIAGTLTRDAKGIDLVIGAKGSPVQLVLSSVYHADIPTGNIPLAEAQRWTEDRRVAQAVPLSLGDSARGFRIVGTTHDYPALYGAELAEGRLWDASLEAVLGAEVALATGLRPGDVVTGSHGMSGMGDRHAESPYRVVGILSPSGAVVDRLILTGLESVWDIHDDGHEHGHAEGSSPEVEGDEDDESHGEHGDHDAHAAHDEHDDHHADAAHDAHDDDHADEAHGELDDDHADEAHGEHDDDHADEAHGEHDDHDTDEAHGQEAGADHDSGEERAREDDRQITAMLVRYASPIAAVSMPRQINAQSNLQAAAPAFELARLLQIVGLGLDGLRAFAMILIASAAFSVFGAMYGALQARRGELAMMRCLGATQAEIMTSLLIEGLLLGVAGALLGVLSGHVAVEVVGAVLAEARGVTVTGLILLPEELVLAGALILVALLAAAVPAWQAYRTDVSRTLSTHG